MPASRLTPPLARGPGRLISPWPKPGALRRNLVNRFQPGWHAEAGNSRSPGDGESDITHPNRQSRGEPIPRPGDGLWRGTDDGIHDRSFPWPRRPINRLYRTTVFRFTPMRRAVSLIPLPSSRCCTIRSIVSAASCDPNAAFLYAQRTASCKSGRGASCIGCDCHTGYPPSSCLFRAVHDRGNCGSGSKNRKDYRPSERLARRAGCVRLFHACLKD